MGNQLHHGSSLNNMPNFQLDISPFSIFALDIRVGCSELMFAPLLFSSLGFPGSSAGKESTCNAGHLGLIPGSGSSSGEGID